MSNPTSVTKPYRVLVVDDDGLSRELVALLLDGDGHQAMKAESGEDALRMLASLDEGAIPEILLVDMRMPGETGSELARHLRQVARGARVLAMSATAPAPEEMKGFDGFLLKPLDLEQFHALAAEELPSAPLPAAPKPAGAGGAILDERIYANLHGTMPDFAVREIYTACLQDARQRVARMREQAASDDQAGLRTTAHAIKGGAGMVGAVEIARLAGLLELGGYPIDNLPVLLGEMLEACDQLERILLTRKGTDEA
jgi:CheY-like chemotaxis protein